MSTTSRTHHIALTGAAWRRQGKDMQEFWHALKFEGMSLFDGFPDLMAAVDMVDRTTVHHDHAELDLTA